MKKTIIFLATISSIILFSRTASWEVRGCNSEFEEVIRKTITAEYSGQDIDEAPMKTLTSNKLNLTYTGIDTTLSGHIYLQIQPKEILGDTVRWIQIRRVVEVRY